MASIYKYEVKKGLNARARTRYRVSYQLSNGTWTQKRGFKSKEEATLFAASVDVSHAKNEFIDPAAGKVTIDELAQAWLRRKEALLKASSYRPLESAYRIHVQPVWGCKAVKAIQQTDVETWVAEMKAGTVKLTDQEKKDGKTKPRKAVGASVVIRAHEILAGVLDDAVKNKAVLKNVARGVQLLKKQNKPNIYLSHEQVRALAESSERAELIYLLAYTGLRWGEAAGLQVKHIDFKRRRISVERNLVELTAGNVDETTPKGGKPRSVPFPEFLEIHLKKVTAHKFPNAAVFTEPNGLPLKRPSHRTGWFVKALAAVDCPRITPHDLRHTAASFAVSAGANVKAVQRMLGHTSASMTLDVYADLFEDDLDGVAIALNQAYWQAM